jgi:hypothetical protein
LPDFSRHNLPKRGKIYQIATKFPNGHEIYPKPSYISNGHIKYQSFQFQGLPKFTQIGNFWFESKPSGNPASVFKLSLKS